MRMKSWQWAILTAEAVLLVGVLGGLAWLLLFHSPPTITQPQTVAQAEIASPTQAPTGTPAPVAMALFTPLPTRTPQPTNTRVISRVALNQGAIDQIEQQVARLRGIRPRATVTTEFLSRAQMIDRVRKGYESDKQSADREIALYRALGLIPAQAQVDSDAMVKTVADSIAGFYDPQDKRLYVISDLENLGADDKVTLAHEYTHALQDQQFDLTRYQNRTQRQTTDLHLALSSLAEGDATTVMSIYLYGNTTQSEWNYLAYRASFSDRSLITATNISTRVSEISYFPYVQGAQFVVKLWLDGQGWAQVNHAYADPPQSTSIVLHPERYLTRYATPMPVPLPDLGPVLGKGFTPTIKADTLGEFITSVHLDEFLQDPERAAQAADGWEGDSFTLWQGPGDRQVFAWQIAWDTPRDVDEFLEAYSALLRRRVGASLAVEREDVNLRWYSGSAGSGLIRKGRIADQTLVLWGPDKATVEKLLAYLK
jgi:hypothetical protein